MLFCGRFEGCRETDTKDGIEIVRKGGPYTVYLHAMKEYIQNLRKRGFDVVIDEINGVPFFTPLYVRGVRKVAIMHHLVKDIFFKELPWHMAVLGYTAEKTIPLIYHETKFIAVSESTRKALVNFGIPEGNIKVVLNGVDHELYNRNPSQKSPYPHIIYLGRIKYYKNLDHLIEAIKIIRNDKNLREKPKLTIAGRGYVYHHLKQLAADRKVQDCIEFLGEVPEQKKIELLQRAWVYVTPSTREGWGLTVIEAAACGTPVIAYDVPGLRDAVVDGRSGILVPYGDIEALAKSIVRVLTDEGLRSCLSENAYRWSLNFNWDKTASDMLRVIEASS
jgi:glycosyltransferase involved in cell wall biosynthesis